MNRRNFLAKSAALPFAVRSTILEAQTGSPRPQDKARPPKPAPASSDSGKPNLDRYHLTLNRVLRGKNPAYTPEFLLADLHGDPGRRFTEFSGDLSGRWIGALAASSSSFGEDFPALDAFVRNALPLQHPEGYFGKSFSAEHPGDVDLALLWGNGRLLVGLMEYYSLRRDPAALAAARRLGDFLVAIGPQFNSQKMADDFGAGHFATSYICWTQQTEGLAALYAETKDSKYRDLCADISARMERRPGDHVHGYLCSVRGTLALYEATRDQAFLDRSVAAWNDINNSGDILITGGVPEAWSPRKMRTEGCAECDWLRLNLALYRATGEEKYLATAESLVFNEFAMNQFATGDFGHAVLYEDFSPETVAVRAWWCCTLHGLHAFPDVNDSVFRHDGSAIVYNLPIDGKWKSRDSIVEARSNLATEGRIRITVQNTAGEHALVVRKPAWADAVVLSRNGTRIDGLKVAKIETGDEIVAEYAMNLSTVSADRVQSRPGRSALYFGPWLLGASSHDQPDYFNELYPDNEIVLDRRRSPYTARGLRFTVAIAARTCACIPAEFPGQAINVELRAVAEQTQYEPARWQTVFLVRQNT
jgi:DUF1680 family protein